MSNLLTSAIKSHQNRIKYKITNAFTWKQILNLENQQFNVLEAKKGLLRTKHRSIRTSGIHCFQVHPKVTNFISPKYDVNQHMWMENIVWPFPVLVLWWGSAAAVSRCWLVLLVDLPLPSSASPPHPKQKSITKTWKHSSRMRTVRLATVRISLVTTRCESWW